MQEDINISREHFLSNGLDIAEVYGRRDVWTEQILSGTLGHMHGSIVTWLNDNGFEQAGQALDDAWYDREEQWWRDADEFDGRFKHGEEKRREIFGQNS